MRGAVGVAVIPSIVGAAVDVCVAVRVGDAVRVDVALAVGDGVRGVTVGDGVTVMTAGKMARVGKGAVSTGVQAD